MRFIFDWLDPTTKKGLVWLIPMSFSTMSLLRSIFNPTIVEFPIEKWMLDYLAMNAMGILVIAIDAVLIVIVSWSNLRGFRDVFGVAALVAGTHILFPLLTFAVAAIAAWSTKAEWIPTCITIGLETTIFFLGFWLVLSHLYRVNREVRETNRKLLEPKGFVFNKPGFQAIWPTVFSVSVDALMVGPAKVAFMDRYSPALFYLSFLNIGIGVGVAVFLAGGAVLGLKWLIRSEIHISRIVHRIDWIGSLAQVFVFVQISVFSGAYVVYTLAPSSFLIWMGTIWRTAFALFVFLYLPFGKIREIKEASELRTGARKNRGDLLSVPSG